MRSQQEQDRRRVTARRTRRGASVSVEWLEGRALLAQTFGFPGLGPVANLPLSTFNPQPLVLDLTPTLTNAAVTRANTSVTGTTTRLTGTTTRLTGTTSFAFTRILPLTIAREFSFRAVQSPSLAPASTTPTNLRLILAPARPTTVVAPTNPPPTPLAASVPAGPLASHGHDRPQHHQHTGPGSLRGHHGR